MKRKSRTEFAILGMLTQGPLSGYDLKNLFEERIVHFWHESVGQIYPTLRRLADAKMVQAKETTGASGPRRVEYRITKKGRNHLDNWLHEPAGKEHVRNELLLKIFFGDHVSAEVMLAQIESFESMQKAIQRQFEHYSVRIDDEATTDLQKTYWQICLGSGQAVNEARLKWCRESKRLLEKYIEKQKSPNKRAGQS